MSVILLDDGAAKARKKHQCFDCYRPIYPGEEFRFAKCVFDGSVYTIRQHPDCHEASCFYQEFHQLDAWTFDMEGIPPLADIISDFGEFESDMALLRGRFPHFVCRMEFREQKAAIRVNEWEMQQ